MRNAVVQGNTLAFTGDVNATTTLEVIGGAPSRLSKLTFNGVSIPFTVTKSKTITASLKYSKPSLNLPDLSRVKWKYLDSLPEIQSTYSDSAWTAANLKKTYNTLRPLTTPTSLYGSDYGYHTGSLLFRGHFTATGVEKTLYLHTQGGSAFGSSVWLGSQFLGSWAGYDAGTNGNNTFTLPNLSSGKEYVITVVVDNMGLDEDWTVGTEQMKDPRGILDYQLSGRSQSAISWKLTGNLGGEDYKDLVRGPLNEGAMFAERQGYHLPNPPSQNWPSVVGGPVTGVSKAGIAFYTTSFDLNLPSGYDIPLSFQFTNSTSAMDAAGKANAYRVQLFVNGYQFGKYVHNVGPQTRFPVPEGILNHHGTNWVAVTLWALEADGAKVENLQLVPEAVVQTGMPKVQLSPMTSWSKRAGAY